MRSGPCLLYMPKIEDWVVGKGLDGEGNKSSNAKHPEGFGTSNAETEDHLREGRRATSLESEDEAALIVSVAWKLMKQQLQTMPPDTQLMLLVGPHFRCSTEFWLTQLIKILSKSMATFFFFLHSGEILRLDFCTDVFQAGNMRVRRCSPPT